MPSKLGNMASARKKVEALLGRPLTEDEFGHLAESWEWTNLIRGDDLDDRVALQDCVDEVESIPRAAATDDAVTREEARASVEVGSMPAGEVRRLRAKALALAALASEEPAYLAWRDEHPTFLPLAEVDRWEGSEGELADLQRLCEQLARSYGWDAHQARGFVLTDAVPVPPWVRVTTRRDSHRWRERIALDIDPDTPAEVVTRIYNETRRAMGRSHRPPDASTLDMVADWAGKMCPDRLPLRKWSEQYGISQASARRKLWNGWEYLTGERFSR